MRYLATALLLLVAAATAAVAQDPAEAQYDSAYRAWDAGDYPEALERLERLLGGPDGDRFLEPVALLTGELYRTTEVAPDGRAIRWSPDGRFAAYETGAAERPSTHIVALEADGIQEQAVVSGHGLAFSPAGPEAAYLVVERTPQLEAAQAEAVRRIGPVRDADTQRRLLRELGRLEAEHTRIVVRDLRTGRERTLDAGGLAVHEVAYGAAGEALYLVAGRTGDASGTDLYALQPGSAPVRLTDAPGFEANLTVVPGGKHLLYTLDGGRIGVLDLATGATRTFAGVQPAFSADGSTLAFVGDPDREVPRGAGSPYADAAVELAFEGLSSLHIVSLAELDRPPLVLERLPIANPALSPDGRRVVYQIMYRDDWELEVTELAGDDAPVARRLTHEIQHDLFPRFLADGRILAVIGEARHRRSYLYDAETGERTRLFHNNTVRTVAPEYEWAISPDGTKVLIVAERDGNTVSPERGVYLTDLSRKVTKDEVLARIRTNLVAERDLRERGERMFAPIADAVREAVADVSVGRIYDYERDLFAFGSKHIAMPGNRPAIEYLAEAFRSFGYEPELQWFEPAPGIRTANVVATLPGTTNPELIYVVSSHFDSSQRGPGADDNTSGTAALLEAARVLRNRPQPATIRFALFTGEEAGLLGSREFVRRAVAAGDSLVGALNNDMIGWTNDHRLDNTIRYSNAGIRDLQHAAAFLFTDLILYDAEYYKSTDAHAYYEVYGDIVGGIGSYPILGNPHYHRSHDVLETIDHRLVAEVSKTTVASLMLLASSPARLKGIAVTAHGGDAVTVQWTPAPERGVTHYIVAYGPEHDPMRRTVTVTEPRARLEDAPAGTRIAVKAVDRHGLEGWDWARVVVGASRPTPAGGRP